MEISVTLPLDAVVRWTTITMSVAVIVLFRALYRREARNLDRELYRLGLAYAALPLGLAIALLLNAAVGDGITRGTYVVLGALLLVLVQQVRVFTRRVRTKT